MNFKEICVSFVHGYSDLDLFVSGDKRPALWRVTPDGEEVFRYPFPRNPSDFYELEGIISGCLPMNGAESFKKLPRFGFTGLSKFRDNYYAGSWNGVYEIDGRTFELKKIITNQMMGDLHGIQVDNDGLLTVLTSQDTVVLSDFDGNVVSHFTVHPDLSIETCVDYENTDWRFVGKQFRGTCGYWHFNYVQKVGDEIWLTSRTANCFVAVDMKTKKAKLRLMNACTPLLLHDGLQHDGSFYFTSIDGKIVSAHKWVEGEELDMDQVENPHIYHKDLVTKLIRLNQTGFGREPNWCRGIDVHDDTAFVTVDGCYGTELSFGLIAVDVKAESDNALHFEKRLKWKDIGDEKMLRYVTGFDVCVTF